MEPIVLTNPNTVYIIAVADPTGLIVSETSTLRVVTDVAWIGTTLRTATLESIEGGLPYQNLPDNDYVYKFSTYAEAKAFSETEVLQGLIDSTLNINESDDGTEWTYVILEINRATTFGLVTEESLHDQDLAKVHEIIMSFPEDLTDAQRRLLIDLMNQNLDEI